MQVPQHSRLTYHPLPLFHTSPTLPLCQMHHQHRREVQYKAEAALFASMRRRQRKSGTTPTGLPSSDALWRSLRQQLMDTLQRFANERKLTLAEANKMLLRTPPQDLTMPERCWLKSMRNLVSIMPPPTNDEIKQYDLSSYPPKLIPRPGRPVAPSTSTETNITPRTLLALATPSPPSPPLGPRPPISTSTTLSVTLPSVPALMCAIFPTGPSPTPASASPSRSAKRHPRSATLMAPPCTTVRPGSSGTSSLPPRPTTPHPRTGRTLCLLGSYGTRDLEELTSRSQTSKAGPSSPTTYRS